MERGRWQLAQYLNSIEVELLPNCCRCFTGIVHKHFANKDVRGCRSTFVLSNWIRREMCKRKSLDTFNLLLLLTQNLKNIIEI